jgi:hypothetical protein
MGPKWTRTRRSTLWLATFGLVAGWIITIGVLILTAPPPGAASPAELVDQASAALASGDAEAFGTLLAPPLDQEFATAYLSRLQEAGVRDVVVALGPRDMVEVRGQSDAGPFAFDLVAVSQDERWFLSALPPV